MAVEEHTTQACSSLNVQHGVSRQCSISMWRQQGEGAREGRITNLHSFLFSFKSPVGKAPLEQMTVHQNSPPFARNAEKY